MSILFAVTVAGAVLLSAVLGYIVGTVMTEVRKPEPKLPRMPRPEPVEDDDNPFPIGSDEFWTWEARR